MAIVRPVVQTSCYRLLLLHNDVLRSSSPFFNAPISFGPLAYLAGLSNLAIFNSEGVCVARKDPFGVHAEINVPNLYVMKLMQSLTSKGLVTATFNWSHHYWFLTNTGIEHLREYLGLPEEIVPATLKRKLQARREGEDRPRGPRFGGKDAAPGEGEFKPNFEGGVRHFRDLRFLPCLPCAPAALIWFSWF